MRYNICRRRLAENCISAFITDAFEEEEDYADYVSIAASNGLILGDDSGRFNPNEPVSRQDAAVMMYRALKTKSQSKKAEFKDYSQISLYAADAINYMYENDIINGVGDDNFAPLASITRAQAAKMMYSLLIA